MSFIMAKPMKRKESKYPQFRRVVPEDVRGIIPVTEIKKSLKTTNDSKAREKQSYYSGQFERLIINAREGRPLLSDRDAEDLAIKWLRKKLAEDEVYRVEYGVPDQELWHREKQREAHLEHGGSNNPPPILLERPYDIAIGLFSEEYIDKGKEAELVLQDIEEGFENEIYSLKIIKEGTQAYQFIVHHFTKAKLDYYHVLNERASGEDHNTNPQSQNGAPRSVAPILSDSNIVTLEQLKERWAKERQPKPKSLAEWNTTIKRFVTLNGNLDINQIQKSQIVAFKDHLVDKGLKAKTVKKQLSAIHSLLQYAMDNDMIVFNPASGVKIVDTERAVEKRLPYDRKDLETIFSFSIYTEQDRPRGGGGEAAYWLPVLALYTGARQSELGQLLITDVKEEGGIHYLDINARDEGKSVKTKGSNRFIPLHSRVIEAGFLNYVRAMKYTKHKRLFPDMKPDVYGVIGGSWSQWWGRYVRGLGLTDKKKVFHSFRHSFKQACRDAGITEEIHDAFTGHANSSVSRTYGSGGIALTRLKTEIEKVSFGVDVPGWDKSRTKG